MSNVKRLWLLTLFMMMIALSGCLYPDEKRAETPVNPMEQIQFVQQAASSYLIDQGEAPVKAAVDADEALYSVLDLRELYPRYLKEYPPDSFEQGGTLVYVMLNEQPDAAVKVNVLDLRFQDEVERVQKTLDNYIERNGAAPRGEQMADGVYLLDSAALALDAPTIRSPFSNMQLNYLVDDAGQVYVDYLPDIAKYRELNAAEAQTLSDLRQLLVRHSFYVPFASLPYLLVDGQIQVKKS
jgi:hypothetical protein